MNWAVVTIISNVKNSNIIISNYLNKLPYWPTITTLHYTCLPTVLYKAFCFYRWLYCLIFQTLLRPQNKIKTAINIIIVCQRSFSRGKVAEITIILAWMTTVCKNRKLFQEHVESSSHLDRKWKGAFIVFKIQIQIIFNAIRIIHPIWQKYILGIIRNFWLYPRYVFAK